MSGRPSPVPEKSPSCVPNVDPRAPLSTQIGDRHADRAKYRRPSPLAWLLIQPIRFYQRFITPYTPATCRYYPTCSSYAVRALRTHGALKGTLLTAGRLLRCNPWSSGGIDYPPPRSAWHGVQTDPDRPAASDATVPPVDPTPFSEHPAPAGRSVTDLCTAQPAVARASIAGSTAA